MTERRFVWLLSIPFVLITALFIGWQQDVLGFGCSVCKGTGEMPMPRIPEDPVQSYETCAYCGFSRARLGHLLYKLDRALPDGSVGPFVSISCIFVGILVWGLRTVRCRACNASGCEACSGKGRQTRLDRLVS